MNQTTSSSTNVDYTMTWRQRLSHQNYGGWWGVFDRLSHQVNLPKQIQDIICDRYEVACGISRELLIEMDYQGEAPWWLKL